MHWTTVVVIVGITVTMAYKWGWRSGYRSADARNIRYLLFLTTQPNPDHYLKLNEAAVRKIAAVYRVEAERNGDWYT